MPLNADRGRYTLVFAAVSAVMAGCGSSPDVEVPAASAPSDSSTSTVAATPSGTSSDAGSDGSAAMMAAEPSVPSTQAATTTTTTTTTTVAPPAPSPFDRTTHVLDIATAPPPPESGSGLMAEIGQRFTLHADSFLLPNASFEQFLQDFSTGYTGTTSISEQMMGTVTFDGTEEELTALVRSAITALAPNGQWSSATDTWYELITVRSDAPATLHALVYDSGRISFAVQGTDRLSVYRYAVKITVPLEGATLETVGPPPQTLHALDTVRATGIDPEAYQLQIRARPDDDGVWHTWRSVLINQLYEGPTIEEIQETLFALGWETFDAPTRPDELRMYDPSTGDAYAVYGADGTEGGVAFDAGGVEIAPLSRSS